MPTRAKLSIMGLYNYDDSIFDKMELPDGIEKEVAIMRILFDNANFELILPQWELVKEMIGVWSKSHFYKWKTLFETTRLEYNPIWNVDANEIETTNRGYIHLKNGSFAEENESNIQHDSETTSEATKQNRRTLDTVTSDNKNIEQHSEVQETNTRTLNTTEETDNTRTLDTQNSADNYGKMAGFNSNNYNNVTNNSGTSNETGTITDDGTRKETGTITDAKENSGNENASEEAKRTETGTIVDDETETVNGTQGTIEKGTNNTKGSNENEENFSENVTIEKRRTGNIGITMTQQLIEAERNIAKFSIYEVISNDFKHEFCIMVY